MKTPATRTLLALAGGALLALPAAAQTPYLEVRATATAMGDVEFDFGRDGVHCPSCNFGDGNDRANWTDRAGNLWIAHLDQATGVFVSPGVDDELADTTAAFWNVYGNGPEWTFSTQDGQVVSQLVYSRFVPNEPKIIGYTGAAFTTQTGYNAFGQANWKPTFFPGAINTHHPGEGTNNSDLPEGSQCNTDPVGLAVWKNFASPLELFTEPLSTATGTAPKPVVMPTGVVANGIGERWVPCTHQLLFQATVPYGDGTHKFQQVFWYDKDTGVVEQLTTDATTKYGGFMFQAPDFGGHYVMYTVVNHQQLNVYEQSGTNPNGSPVFTLVNTIVSPEAAEPYLNSSEPFINCTPTCTTYAFSTVSKSPSSQNGLTIPNGLAVFTLNPARPMATLLVSGLSEPVRQRLDPEYFITDNGPYLYYNRIVPKTGSTDYHNEGEFFIDMLLGAPSGPCVGSSAEDGLVAGCANAAAPARP
jgi:hypothetical protein